MIVICGLGNPGTKYKGTRHNLGFAFIDAILKKYKFGSIDNIDTKNFFNKIQSEYGDIIRKNLNDEEKEVFIGELVSLIKADDKVHDHEFFLLGHVANSIGYSPEKVAEIIQNKGISSSKSSGWFSWLFG